MNDATVEQHRLKFADAFRTFSEFKARSRDLTRRREELPIRIVELNKKLEHEYKKLTDALSGYVHGTTNEENVRAARASVTDTEQSIAHARELLQAIDKNAIGFSVEYELARNILDDSKTALCTAHARAIIQRIFNEKNTNMLFAAYAAARHCHPVDWDIFLDAMLPNPFVQTAAGQQFNDVYVEAASEFERQHIQPITGAN